MRDQKGQSLVEVTILIPILIFIMLALVEVGWGIRSYLILVNGTREAARQASRTGTLNFRDEVPDYDSVLDQMLVSMGQTNNSGIRSFSLEQNATVQMHHFYIGTGRPCFTSPCVSPCNAIPESEINHLDDLILSPLTTTNFYTSYGVPRMTEFSSYEEFADTLIERSVNLHCQMEKRAVDLFEPSDNSVIVVESHYSHNQLFGFPVLSNALTDPMDLSTSTTMRINSVEDQHIACELAPIAINQQLNSSLSSHQSFAMSLNQDFVWLRWSNVTEYPISGTNVLEYLILASENHRLNLNEYSNPFNSSDQTFDTGDAVWKSVGIDYASISAEDQFIILDNLVRKTLKIAVYDVDNGSSVNSSGYASIIVTDVDFSSVPMTIHAQYVAESDTCEGL